MSFWNWFRPRPRPPIVVPPAPAPPTAVQINTNFTGDPGDNAFYLKLTEPNNSVVPGRIDSPTRVSFNHPGPLPSPFGANVVWKDQMLGWLIIPPPGASEASLPPCNLSLNGEPILGITFPAPIQPIPPAPSRLDVLNAKVGFQGLSIRTRQFGTIRAWGPELGSLADDDAISYVQQAMQAGWSAVEFAVSWKYSGSNFQYPVPGLDLSQNLPELRRKIKQAIAVGAPLGLKGVYLFCAGDGESVNDNPQPGQYNDPVGWTYGRTWLMQNFDRIHAAFGPQPDDPIDLRGWIIFHGGYDGCDAYQWLSGDNVVGWWHLLRRTIDAIGAGVGGYAGYEWSAGQCQLGDGFPTYTPENGGCIDQWLLEGPIGPYPPQQRTSIQQLTQQLNRMCDPYIRPSWAVDDPDRRYYGPFNTARGPAVVIMYEFDTYSWVRGMLAATVDDDRMVLRQMIPGTPIC